MNGLKTKKRQRDKWRALIKRDGLHSGAVIAFHFLSRLLDDADLAEKLLKEKKGEK